MPGAILTAEQVQALTKKHIAVVPTKTFPEGITALLAFDYEADFKTNTETMTKAKSAVKTVSITRAIRSTQIGGLKIRKRQFIAFLNSDLVAVGDSTSEVLNEVLSRLSLDKAEVMTIYYGDTTRPAEAEEMGAEIRKRYPQLQVELVHGGQPHYNYIVSIE
jgi:dihydroxyacetone kinase-like predicted kinase